MIAGDLGILNTKSQSISSRGTDQICMEYSTAHIELTHCGLVTPYGDRDLGQHWLR